MKILIMSEMHSSLSQGNHISRALKSHAFFGIPKTRKVFVIFGPPGAGKGTQASLLSKSLSYLHLSTGQMLRDAVKEKSELGKKVEKTINSGNLISDEMISEIIDEFLSKSRDSGTARHCQVPGIILDGYPRTVNQCVTMDSFSKKYNLEIEIINLTTDSKELVKRLLKRADIEKRKDDNEQTIKTRLEVYKKETAPVLDFYRKKKARIYNIDGLGTIEEVNKKVMSKLEKKV
jgi:adenylate kinase